MELTEKQKQGLELALQRYRENYQYTVIAGYARNREVYAC